MALNTCSATSQNDIAHSEQVGTDTESLARSSQHRRGRSEAAYRQSKMVAPSEHDELTIHPASILSANLKRQVELVLIPPDPAHQSAGCRRDVTGVRKSGSKIWKVTGQSLSLSLAHAGSYF